MTISIDERLNAPVSTAELERRWTAVRNAMEAAGIDVLLMQANNDFMGGYVKWFTDLPATNGYAVIATFPYDAGMTLIGQGPFGGDHAIPTEGDGVRRGVARLLTCPSYATAGFTHTYEADLAAQALAPFARGTVGLVGRATLSYDLMQRLVAGVLASARIVDFTDAVDRIKAVKSPEEIAAMRRTAAMQDDAMHAAMAAVHPGARDRDVTAAAEYASLSRGSEQGLYMCASAPVGAAVLFANRHHQDRVIAPGDQLALLIENGGPGGMFTELGRTAVLGRATDAMHAEFEFVMKARRFMLDRLRAGADCAAIFTDYNGFMQAHGKPPEQRLHCHGMGYDMVERPLVRHDETMRLAAGMVVACHPTYALGGGLHWICDNYLIGDREPERLHRYPEHIIELAP